MAGISDWSSETENLPFWERPEIVVMSKCELPDSAAVRAALSAAIGGEVLAASAVTGQGLDTVVRAIVAALDRRRESA